MPQPNYYPAAHINPPNVLGKAATAAQTRNALVNARIGEAELENQNRLLSRQERLAPLMAAAAEGDELAIRGLAQQDPTLAGKYVEFNQGFEDRAKSVERQKLEGMGRLIAAYESMPEVQKAGAWPRIREEAAKIGVDPNAIPEDPPTPEQVAVYKSQLMEADKLFEQQEAEQLKFEGGLFRHPVTNEIDEGLTQRAYEQALKKAQASATQVNVGGKPLTELAKIDEDVRTGRMTPEEGMRQKAKKLDYTEGQVNSAGYARRVEFALDEMSDLTTGGFDPTGLMDAIARKLPLGNYLRSSEAQVYWSAAEDLANAVNRRDSGAAVPDSEVAAAIRRYLPLPGESAVAVDAKRKRVEEVLKTFKQQSRGAYDDMFPSEESEPDKLVEDMTDEEVAEYLKANGIKPEPIK